MCVIMIKERGVKFPAESVIRQCMDSNPHGFAFMWHDGKHLNSWRSMSKDETLAKYASLKQLGKGAVVVFHARIATHGTVGLKNCHGWQAKLGKRQRVAFMHNGVLGITNRNDMTDSETFLRDMFVPVYRNSGWRAAKEVANAVIGTSKFAFLFSDGSLERLGRWQTSDGCLFSNLNWKPWTTYSYTKKSTTKAAPKAESEYDTPCDNCTDFDCGRCDENKRWANYRDWVHSLY